MKILCISASNIEPARDHSASTWVCELVRERVTERRLGDEVTILPLIDYDMKPCRMCGRCYQSRTNRCALDEDFNRVYAALIAADAVFLVCPHYAPIPSKVMILMEKLEEIAYLNWSGDPLYRSDLYGKPAGIIAHGGQDETDLVYYKTALLDPLAGALGSVGMRVIGAGKAWPNGVAFGIKKLFKPDHSIFVTIEHDLDTILKRIDPLVANVLAAV